MTVLDLEMTLRKSAVVLVANVLKTSHNSCDPTLSPTVKVKKEPNPRMQGCSQRTRRWCSLLDRNLSISMVPKTLSSKLSISLPSDLLAD